MPPLRSIQLFFQEGASDKVYNAQILKEGDAYTVAVQWGRRGSTLATGNKAVKVALAVATRTFHKLVREKTSKGYEEVAGDKAPATIAPPEGAGSGSKVTGKRARVGHAAQLLTALEDDELEACLTDDALVAQQKLDGIRVLVRVDADGQLVATNRDGQATELARQALAGLAYLPKGTVVDGEVLGDAFWLFDLLVLAGDDVRARGYLERWALLDEELEPALTEGARVLPVARGTKAKRKLHDQLRAASAEGVVFKRGDAPYKSGRGTTQRKYKFVKACDVIVLENAGNAYRMAVYDGKALFDVGRVFAGTTNASRKELDASLGRGERPVCEVKYLYATDDHQLFQPVFVRIRDDKAAKACVRAQLVRTDRGVIA